MKNNYTTIPTTLINRVFLTAIFLLLFVSFGYAHYTMLEFASGDAYTIGFSFESPNMTVNYDAREYRVIVLKQSVSHQPDNY